MEIEREARERARVDKIARQRLEARGTIDPRLNFQDLHTLFDRCRAYDDLLTREIFMVQKL